MSNSGTEKKQGTESSRPRRKTPAAIQVQNLSKKYIIRSSKRFDPKLTLRDDLMRMSRRTWNSLMSLASFQDRVSDQHEEFMALEDINFRICEGDVVGLIGRNGAGKSTLLKLLCRITEPTTGRIRMRGRVASLLEIGTGFHPELSGRENVFLNGAILGMTRKEIATRFDEIVDFAGIEQFLDTPVKRYSSGMFVRLAFSVAAHLEPEILLVDEVLAVGDVAFQRKCMGKMNEVAHESGRTIIFVSHNMSSIQRLCKRAIFLNEGRLMFDGNVREAVDQYLQATAVDVESGFNLRLRPRSRFWKITDILLDTCLILNGDGVPSPSVRFGENWQIYLEFLSGEDVDQFNIQISIDDQNHARILTLNSADHELSFSSRKDARVCIRIQPEHLKLSPGLYDISITATHTNALLDRLDQASRLEIKPVPAENISVPNDRPGVMMPDCSWHLDELSESVLKDTSPESTGAGR